MKNNWFKEWGWIYIPISWQGYLAAFLTLVFNVQVFQAVDKTSHSGSDTLYGIFPYLIGSLVILFFIAAKTSKKK